LFPAAATSTVSGLNRLTAASKIIGAV